MSPLTVVHLVSASYDAQPVRHFAQAYTRHEAGRPHQLLIALNGFDGRDASEHLAALDGLDATVVRVPRSTIDLNSYIRIAHDADGGQLCFLNSHSEPLVDGWLQRLVGAGELPGVGIAGATGSWETIRSRNPFSRWPKFPNAHLRTNAFVIDRDLMVSLDWPHVTDKRRAWQLESGPRSVTRQVMSEGLEAVVVGREGVYAPSDWAASHTFRTGAQENLLVADNRTRQWDDAEHDERAALSSLAWGSAHEYPRAGGHP